MTKMDVDTVRICSTKEHPIAVGVKRWALEYNVGIVKETVLQESIDKYMEQYDTKVMQEKAEAEELGKPDEDGWVTVTRAAKKPPAKAKKEQENNKKGGIKKKKKELKNFYAFQMKDEKLNRIQELRRKFEED